MYTEDQKNNCGSYMCHRIYNDHNYHNSKMSHLLPAKSKWANVKYNVVNATNLANLSTQQE